MLFVPCKKLFIYKNKVAGLLSHSFFFLLPYSTLYTINVIVLKIHYSGEVFVLSDIKIDKTTLYVLVGTCDGSVPNFIDFDCDSCKIGSQFLIPIEISHSPWDICKALMCPGKEKIINISK